MIRVLKDAERVSPTSDQTLDTGAWPKKQK